MNNKLFNINDFCCPSPPLKCIAEQMEILGMEMKENDTEQGAEKKTYTIDGRTVGNPQSTSLPKGLFINNGKKYIVR